MSGGAYLSDVEFLEDANPELIEAAASEYRRLHALLASCEDDFRKAKNVEWESESYEKYARRLTEATDLAEYLPDAFKRVGAALDKYAGAVETAKRHFDGGQTTESRLADVMAREATAVTPTARAAEPLRQWEDLRSSTGFLDWVAELGVDLDEIRDEAERYYSLTKDQYGDARRIEAEAREECVHEVSTALRSLPDFRGGNFVDVGGLLSGVEALHQESREAADDANVQLEGTGKKVDTLPVVGPDVLISPTLMRIKKRAAGAEADENYHWLPSNSDDERRQYISNNRELLRDAAQQSGLPPEMVAGIAWQEVEGDPSWTDDVVPFVRENAPGTEDPDLTSLGPMSLQVRRAAEVLGYDPQNLSDFQRDQVTGALKNPAQNIYIASEYLAQLKAESEFADVPPEEMTPEQMQELAARYNGGPYYESDQAQAYGRGFTNKLPEAEEALK